MKSTDCATLSALIVVENNGMAYSRSSGSLMILAIMCVMRSATMPKSAESIDPPPLTSNSFFPS